METRLTERARRTLDMAQEEGRRLGAPEIGTELLLLALLRENESVAAKILGRMGVTLAAVRADLDRGEWNHPAPARDVRAPKRDVRAPKIARNWLGREVGVKPLPKEIPLSMHYRLALEMAEEESRRFDPGLRRGFIGTEHLLLGLLRERNGVAALVFGRLGLDGEAARAQVMEYLPTQESAENKE